MVNSDFGLKETFDGIIVTRTDLENFDKYNKMNQAEKDYVWQYAKHYLPDILLQDYEICIESCIDSAINRKNLDEKESLYDKGEL